MFDVPKYSGYLPLDKVIQQVESCFTRISRYKRHATLIYAQIDERDLQARHLIAKNGNSLGYFTKWLKKKIKKWYGKARAWKDDCFIELHFKQIAVLGKFITAEFFAHVDYRQLLVYLQAKIRKKFPSVLFIHDATIASNVRPHISLAKFYKKQLQSLQLPMCVPIEPLRLSLIDKSNIRVGAYYVT